MRFGIGRAWLGVLCASALALGAAAPTAQAAFDDPLFIFKPLPQPLSPFPTPPPTGAFEGPCGLAVDSGGNFYVSDYYHHAVDVFSAGAGYIAQIAKVDPLDGPCGLALDAADNVYVNDFHRNVVKFGPLGSFGTGTTIDGAGLGTDPDRPTGVAVDKAGGSVYVDDRTHIAVFDSAGVEQGQIGAFGNGHGLAVSEYGSTKGLLYVPDAATDEVLVYDPATPLGPVTTIDGSGTPNGRFISLRDSAIAVDKASGEIYVVDDVTPEYAAHHEGVVYVFSAAGAFEGQLKFSIDNALPPGLAVDNSAAGTKGRVYITSGNSDVASVYVYPAHAATSAAVPLPKPLPAAGTPDLSSSSSAATAAPVSSAANVALDSAAPVFESASRRRRTKRHRHPSAQRLGRETIQKGGVRVDVTGDLTPKRLPRKGSAPIAVTVGGKISSADKGPVPNLKTLRIEFHRAGIIDYTGLPLCPYDAIQPASSKRARNACRSALVGSGSFSAEISLGNQEPYSAKGQLLAFNGRSHGKPVLFAQIYSPHPFATSFVIVFAIKRQAKGSFGTVLSASLPKSLGAWGRLTGIELRLSRRYSYRGRARSYLSAGCPAPAGSAVAVFPFAKTSFGFEGGQTLASTLIRSCKAKEN